MDKEAQGIARRKARKGLINNRGGPYKPLK
jgi:hypothetical protein